MNGPDAETLRLAIPRRACSPAFSGVQALDGCYANPAPECAILLARRFACTNNAGRVRIGREIPHILERVMKPHELAALDQDEAVLFTRRGLNHLAILPQPEFLPGVSEALQKARHDIETSDHGAT